MDKTQKIKADLEAYRASKQNTNVAGNSNIKSDLEAYRASKIQPPETRESRIEQGLPVGMGDNVKPTMAGSFIRAALNPFAKLAASVKATGQALQGKQPTDMKSDYFGTVEPIGKGFDVTKGLQENIKPLKDAVGTGAELASFIPVVRGAKVGAELIKQPFKQSIKQSAKALGKEGVVQGGLGGFGVSLQNDDNLAKTVGNTLIGAGLGGTIGAGLGAGGSALTRTLTKKPVDFVSKQIDNNIRKALSDTVGDIEQLEKTAFGARKGLEMLVTEAPNIQVIDSKAPLGSRVTKSFDINKASPNEWIAGVNKLGNKIAIEGRKAAENATQKGFSVDVEPARRLIQNAVDTGRIGKSSADDLLRQLDSTQNRPIDIHNWIQEQVNIRHFKKSGDLKSSQIATIANDAAEILRNSLDELVDRKGYAESYGAYRDLLKLVVSAAKKANRKANFDDLSTDIGIDTPVQVTDGVNTSTLADGSYSIYAIGTGQFYDGLSAYSATLTNGSNAGYFTDSASNSVALTDGTNAVTIATSAHNISIGSPSDGMNIYDGLKWPGLIRPFRLFHLHPAVNLSMVGVFFCSNPFKIRVMIIERV